ncbi:hypothetical protein FOZ60_008672 [Perkinsus olseni]|uniref:Uncharacterized protein n=1 Tax=Perkinsus olseni TaxID=32597 RepID=A0A7J6NIS2_PEROL|nr:hypothetical protein FOZ60_008672 [Perkinsus olseni]
MLASLALYVITVMLRLSVAQRPAPPSGKYSKVVFPPTDCIQVDFLPGEAPDVSLFIDCGGHTETSPDLSVVERGKFHYEVAPDSIPAYNDYILTVGAQCPYDVQDGDLKTFDYDYKVKTVTVKFEGNPATLDEGDCPGR